MAAICHAFRKTLQGKPSLLTTVPVYNTWGKYFISEYYRRHSLEYDESKRKLTGVEKLPVPPQEIIDIEESTSEWKYVERLLPQSTVPIITDPENHLTFSGWKPPAKVAPNLPYYVRRQRNQLPPVYYALKKAQSRPVTILKYIEGDIWALEGDLKKHLEDATQKPVYTQVHEVANFIRFRGQYVDLLRDWLYKQGF